MCCDTLLIGVRGSTLGGDFLNRSFRVCVQEITKYSREFQIYDANEGDFDKDLISDANSVASRFTRTMFEIQLLRSLLKTGNDRIISLRQYCLRYAKVERAELCPQLWAEAERLLAA